MDSCWSSWSIRKRKKVLMNYDGVWQDNGLGWDVNGFLSCSWRLRSEDAYFQHFQNIRVTHSCNYANVYDNNPSNVILVLITASKIEGNHSGYYDKTRLIREAFTGAGLLEIRMKGAESWSPSKFHFINQS